MVNPYDPSQGFLTFPDLIERITANISIYFVRDIPLVLFPSRFETTMHHAADFSLAISLFLSLLLLVGFVWHLVKHRDILSLYMFFYLGILILWPQVWSGGRFLVPIVPFLLYFLVFLIKQVGEIFSRYILQKQGNVLLGAGLLLLVLFHVKNVYQYQDFMANYPPDWANYFEAAEWAKENTPEDCIIADRKAELFCTTANRKAGGFLRITDHYELINDMVKKDVDYVILASIPYADYSRFLLPAIQAYPDRRMLIMYHSIQHTY